MRIIENVPDQPVTDLHTVSEIPGREDRIAYLFSHFGLNILEYRQNFLFFDVVADDQNVDTAID